MAQWRKVVVSGSNAVLNEVSASGDIVPISDAGSSLGSSTREWNNLYIDGTANIDSLVADTADINGGTVDGITSLTAGGNLDIGAHGFRANTLTADAQTDGRVAIYSTAGLLSEDSDLTFSGATLSATNLTTTGTIKDFSVASGSATSTGSFGRTSTDTLNLDSIQGNWTNAGNTVADLGTITTIDINGGTINGITDLAVADGGTGVSTLTDGGILLGSGTGAITATAVLADGEILIGDGTTDPVALDVGGNGGITILGTIATGVWQGTAVADTYVANDLTISGGTVNNSTIGASSHTTIKGTTIDATTDFTIDGLVLTADTITNDSNLTMDLAGDLAIDVDGGDVIITDDGANIATINATKISGSLASTGSFGRVEAVTLKGDGSGITGLTSAAIDTVAAMTNNYVITATAGTAVTGEANLQFDGTDLLVGGGGKVAFRDNGGEYIYSVGDNVLGLVAGSEIDLTATTIDINGLVDISGNLTVGGDLDVNGTTTTIDSTNVMVSESFTTHASGSTTAVDGGIGVQFRLNGDTRALGWDASGTRWSLQNDLSYTGSLMSPDAYVATVETGTGDGDSQGNPTYGGATGHGNIYIDTDDGEIWIFA